MTVKYKPTWWRWPYLPEKPHDPFGMRKKILKTVILGTLTVGAVSLTLYDRIDLYKGGQRLTSYVRENGKRDIIIATTILLTSGSSFTAPADWNNSSNTIECYGGGGGGGGGAQTSGGGGGGGGGYSITYNVTVSGSAGIAVGGGGPGTGVSVGGVDNPASGGTTAFTGANSATGGAGGKGHSSFVGGGGGGGTHTGGSGGTSTQYAGGAGGGCAGPNGNGGSASGASAGAGAGGEAGSGGGVGGGGSQFGGGGGGGAAQIVGGTAGAPGAQGIIVVTYNPIPAPTVTGVSPTFGTTNGGNSVTISGTSFVSLTAVTFGGVGAAVTSVPNANTLVATSPAHAAGVVDIQVSNTSGSSPLGAADHFQFIAPPTITSISPASGLASGGTAVTVNGSSFTTASGATFGGVAGTGFTINSDTQITVTSPAYVPGVVDIVVTNAVAASPTSAADQFTYLAPTAGFNMPMLGM